NQIAREWGSDALRDEIDAHQGLPAIEGLGADMRSSCTDDVEISRLARLPVVEYERERREAAERLRIRAPILDRLVASERMKSDENVQGRALALPQPEPWPQLVEGAAPLEALVAAIRGHVVMSIHAAVATALWVIHTYLLDAFDITPRLAVTSP